MIDELQPIPLVVVADDGDEGEDEKEEEAEEQKDDGSEPESEAGADASGAARHRLRAARCRRDLMMRRPIEIIVHEGEDSRRSAVPPRSIKL